MIKYNLRSYLGICAVVVSAYFSISQMPTFAQKIRSSDEIQRALKEGEARKKAQGTQRITRTDPELRLDIEDKILKEQKRDTMKKSPDLDVVEIIRSSAQDAQKGLGTYGNWYGPDWCGGQRPSENNGAIGNLEPVDSLDEICRDHDMNYSFADSLTNEREKIQIKKRADIELLSNLNDLDEDPKNWSNPPEDSKRANSYKRRAIEVFKFK